ncbi:MAG TPA: hypothetical protein VF026_00205 [Ktedonobacteraceae bacterium]
MRDLHLAEKCGRRTNSRIHVMLPARYEEEVIQTTIERVVRANYPISLLEVAVICSVDDTGTIAKAQQKIAQLRRLLMCVRLRRSNRHRGPTKE